MRFHVLGVGAIGTLLSFHLKRSARRLAELAHEGVAEVERTTAAAAAPPPPPPPPGAASSLPSSAASSFLPSTALASHGGGASPAASSSRVTLQSFPHPLALKHLSHPDDVGVILRLRESSFARLEKAARQTDHGVVVERDGVREREGGFGLELVSSADEHVGGRNAAETVIPPLSHGGMEALGRSVLEDQGYPPGSIDTLIVTTKAQRTLAALRPIARYITPASTIVLLQNGQGVLDVLLENLFPDPRRRPNFILASTTHGAWTKGKLHTVHAAVGRIELGIVPSPIMGPSYEREWQQPPVVEDDELRDPDFAGGERGGFTGAEGAGAGIAAERAGGDGIVEERSARSRDRNERFRQLNSTLERPLQLDLGAIPRLPETETLVQSMAMLLNLPLQVHWHPIRRFQLMSMRKLVVNACINPLTAIVGCRNGELFGNRYAEQTIRDVCHEAAALLAVLAERAHKEGMKRQLADGGRSPKQQQQQQQRSVGPSAASRSMLSGPLATTQDYLLTPSTLLGDSPSSGTPALDPSLSERALVAEVQRVLRLTAPNYSSMYQDVYNTKNSNGGGGGGTTEIAFINGYLGRLGRSLGIPTPVNDTLTKLVQIKSTKTMAGSTLHSSARSAR